MNETERELLLKLASIVAGGVPATTVTELDTATPGKGQGPVKSPVVKTIPSKQAQQEILDLMNRVRTLAHVMPPP